ncbi:hypothetical protein TCAL_15181 [Tigriopus californicus]|uniref:Uncharacterized protein n=1 Tax=Tigriopus californicus TaxID=6832 RepID=A0A553NDB0_TIGCA|nr:hypothetical protein TCAL_15181 [Tigriopus californicus]
MVKHLPDDCAKTNHRARCLVRIIFTSRPIALEPSNHGRPDLDHSAPFTLHPRLYLCGVTNPGSGFKAGQWVDFMVPGCEQVGGFSMTSSRRNSSVNLIWIWPSKLRRGNLPDG